MFGPLPDRTEKLAPDFVTFLLPLPSANHPVVTTPIQRHTRTATPARVHTHSKGAETIDIRASLDLTPHERATKLPKRWSNRPLSINLLLLVISPIV
jgi:hypothetical protein